MLTLPLRQEVRVVRVLALAARRGPAPEARGLYEELGGGDALMRRSTGCALAESTAYPGLSRAGRPHVWSVR